ncbi:hypothetical protein [Myxococcus landrumensis]|uniref:Uncharacterized protein n=1 Tax=Myxococcus landrumensis TaxID=2813577 RepID=A0ABX7NDG2_9BACT|nr:hypothetical protein [Myxococcus landrumus]QSQ16862.1 hypothetical protein JY572_12770 [Myxococcus landrumus]
MLGAQASRAAAALALSTAERLASRWSASEADAARDAHASRAVAVLALSTAERRAS